jgi:hypothetical protein
MSSSRKTDSSKVEGAVSHMEKHPKNPRGKLRLFIALAAFVSLALALTAIGRVSSQATPSQDPAADQMQRDPRSPRAYQFTGQGQILGGSGSTWLIGGVPIGVSGQTQTTGNLQAGGSVSLLGHISVDGTWWADRVEPISEDLSFFSFAGPLQSRAPTTWKIAGITLLIDKNTEMEANLAEGELVLATFKVRQDGAWLATKIETLADATEEPTPTPTSSPTPASPVQHKSQNNPAPTQKPAGKPPKNSGGVTICHKPNGKSKGHNMVVDGPALASHLGHGDTLGPCSGKHSDKHHK